MLFGDRKRFVATKNCLQSKNDVSRQEKTILTENSLYRRKIMHIDGRRIELTENENENALQRRKMFYVEG